MGEKRFREALANRWPISLADTVGHVMLAVLLPGRWWFQVLPDGLLPVALFLSLRSDRFLPEGATLLIVHRLLHTIWPVLALLGLMALSHSEVIGFMALQWFAHVLWDQFTHPEADFRKDLLWP